jgi:hypothetical protein
MHVLLLRLHQITISNPVLLLVREILLCVVQERQSNVAVVDGHVHNPAFAQLLLHHLKRQAVPQALPVWKKVLASKQEERWTGVMGSMTR